MLKFVSTTNVSPKLNTLERNKRKNGTYCLLDVNQNLEKVSLKLKFLQVLKNNTKCFRGKTGVEFCFDLQESKFV